MAAAVLTVVLGVRRGRRAAPHAQPVLPARWPAAARR